MQAQKHNSAWISSARQARARALEPFASYLSCKADCGYVCGVGGVCDYVCGVDSVCDRGDCDCGGFGVCDRSVCGVETLLLAVKGRRGLAEEARGRPFSGQDGKALGSACERLGWEIQSCCGVLLAPLGPKAETLEGNGEGEIKRNAGAEAETLKGERLRLLIEILDPMVIVALDKDAYQALSEMFASAEGAPVKWAFETAAEVQGRLLVSIEGFEAALNSEAGKQRVWRQLKQASYAETLKRFG